MASSSARSARFALLAVAAAGALSCVSCSGDRQLAASAGSAAPSSAEGASRDSPIEATTVPAAEMVSTTPPAPPPTGSPDGSPTTAASSVSTVIVTTTTIDPRPLAVQFAGITAPVAVGTSGGATWDRVAAETDQPKAARVPTIPGFTAVRSPAIPLADGRVLLVGTSDQDAPIPSRYRRNPAAEPPDRPEPEWSPDAKLPVRLFVYDPAGGQLAAISDIPSASEYRTAISEGSMPEAVINVRVLAGEHLVAYSVGLVLAAYDLEREIYIAPIPPAG